MYSQINTQRAINGAENGKKNMCRTTLDMYISEKCLNKHWIQTQVKFNVSYEQKTKCEDIIEWGKLVDCFMSIELVMSSIMLTNMYILWPKVPIDDINENTVCVWV